MSLTVLVIILLILKLNLDDSKIRNNVILIVKSLFITEQLPGDAPVLSRKTAAFAYAKLC